MSLEALLAAVEADAKTHATAIRDAAREQASAVIARAAAAVDRRRAVALARLDQARRGEMAREAAAAERALREQVLAARSLVLGQVRQETRLGLTSLGIAGYAALVPALVAETLAYLEDRPSVLCCPPDAAEVVRHAAAGREQVSVEPGAGHAAGLTGASRDGTVQVDNTLAGRLDRSWDDLAIQVARRLEREGVCVGMT